MKRYCRFNSGFIGGEREIDIYKPKLSTEEQEIAQEIRRRIARQPNTTVVELGGMFAGSLTTVATKFREQIGTGQLKIIVTNKESFEPQEAISEARRRLTGKSRETPLVFDEDTLGFLQENQPLLTWVSQIQSETVDKQLEPVRADVVLEHFGGLFHATNRPAALSAVNRLLKPGGYLVTGMTPNERGEGFQPFSEVGFRSKRDYQWGVGGMRWYKKVIKD